MLNNGQTIAKTKIQQFLSNPTDKYLLLNAPSGFGKTYLLNEIRDSLEHTNNRRALLSQDKFNDFVFTATTNKAASLLEAGMTVYKLFGLTLIPDKKSGGKVLTRTKRSEVLHNQVICVDEASMGTPKVLEFIETLTENCKVIFILDENQLAPIGCSTIPVTDHGYPSITLDEPMRQDKDSHLFKVCTALRESVINKTPPVIELGPGVRAATAADFMTELNQAYVNGEDVKTLAYTNKQVIGFNKTIRKTLQHPEDWVVTDRIITKNMCLSLNKDERTYAEMEDTILEIDDTVQLMDDIPYQVVRLNAGHFRLPTDSKLWFAEKSNARRSKDWGKLFRLEENFLDVRSGYASTVHSAQGSSYDKVFVDLVNMAGCYDPDTHRRMLYVAISRAKEEVIVYGL